MGTLACPGSAADSEDGRIAGGGYNCEVDRAIVGSVQVPIALIFKRSNTTSNAPSPVRFRAFPRWSPVPVRRGDATWIEIATA